MTTKCWRSGPGIYGPVCPPPTLPPAEVDVLRQRATEAEATLTVHRFFFSPSNSLIALHFFASVSKEAHNPAQTDVVQFQTIVFLNFPNLRSLSLSYFSVFFVRISCCFSVYIFFSYMQKAVSTKARQISGVKSQGIIQELDLGGRIHP